MKQITIDYTDEQMKAMEYIALKPQEWIQNAWDNRARQAIDEITEKYSDKQPKKVSVEEKLSIVRTAKVETAAARQARFEKEMENKKSQWHTVDRMGVERL